MTRSRRPLFVAVAALAFACMAGGRARAGEAAECRVRSIAPSAAASAPDSRLADIAPILQRGTPFRGFVLLADRTVQVALKAVSAPILLPDGKALTLAYLTHIGTPRPRLEMRVVVDSPRSSAPPDVSTTLRIDDGGTITYVLPGTPNPLLIAITCKATG